MGSQPLVSCMKGCFLIFNFVFWLTGLALLIIGILTKFAFNDIMKLSTDINYNLGPYIMIGCGVFIVLIGFVGCWAAVKEHSWALKIYMFVLIVIFIIEMIGAITGYAFRNKLKKGLEKGLRNAVDNYKTDKDLKEGLDKIQAKVKCCGVNSYKDFFNSSASNSTVKSVPKTCCKNQGSPDCHYKDLNGFTPDKMGIHTHGCYNELLDQAKGKFLLIGGVALGIALFQILGVVCAYILTKQFKSSYEQM
ncbi:tetraspanin-6-like [Hydractinia symbiolongicarpus]|uniref:tetraspanin-6-like n=1 Tax=Hydractinia symbiolongicarpus TaxID=13093 RepID=UPI00254F5428|nr:tetraspanin-6-like [Hydractinia symbiolongicarpus]